MNATPDVQILCYPPSKTPNRATSGLNVVDTFGATLFSGLGDTGPGLTPDGSTSAQAYAAAFNPTVNDAWWQTSQYTGPLTGVRFVRFLQNGEYLSSIDPSIAEGVVKGELCGWILAGRLAVLNSKIGSNAANFTQTPAQTWESQQGTWKTALVPGSPPMTGISNVGNDANYLATARTVGTIPANRGVWWRLTTTGGNPAGPIPAIILYIGDGTYGVMLPHDSPPCLVTQGSDGVPQVLKWLGSENVNLHGGFHDVQLYRVADHIVILYNGNRWWYRAFRPNPFGGSPDPAPATWPEGHVMVRVSNCRASVGFGTVKWSSPTGAPYLQSITRRTPANVPPLAYNQTIKAQVSGWYNRNGVGIVPFVAPEGTPLTSGATNASGALLCSYALSASADGIDTPLLTKSLIQADATWTVGTPAPIDIRPAVSRMSLSMAQPPIQPGATGSITVSRRILSLMGQQATPAYNWQDYVHKYQVIEIKVRDRDVNGNALGDYYCVFKGYIQSISKTGGIIGEGSMTLNICDPILRLQEPAGKVTHRHPLMDVFFARSGFDAATSGLGDIATAFYGFDAVREVLRLFNGAEADDLVTGLGIGFPSSHYPLLSLDIDRAGYLPVVSALSGGGSKQMTTTGGLLLPAPYGSDAVAWIGQFQKYDSAVFFYRWKTGDDRTTTWPKPHYGRLYNFLAGRPTYTVYDAPYTGLEADRWLFESSVETRPERDYNKVIVNSNPPDYTDNGLFPALRIGQSSVEQWVPNDPERASQSWERTLIIRSDFGYFPGVAEKQAESIAYGLAGVERIWPTVTVTGDARINWGDGVTFKMSGYSRPGATRPADYSDSTLGLDGKTFRAERIEHRFEFSQDTPTPFVTVLTMRPLTGQGV